MINELLKVTLKFEIQKIDMLKYICQKRNDWSIFVAIVKSGHPFKLYAWRPV